MSMHPHSQNIASRTQSAAQTPHAAKGGSRLLMVAVSLCGALAGASIVEAIAALTSRSGVPIAPDHLIAVPLALVGALCGGFLAAVIVGKDPRTAHDQENTPVGVLTPGETMPGEPMLWQPIPAVGARALTTGDVAPTSQTSLRTRRVRRAIRERGYSHHDNHSRTSHTATRH